MKITCNKKKLLKNFHIVCIRSPLPRFKKNQWLWPIANFYNVEKKYWKYGSTEIFAAKIVSGPESHWLGIKRLLIIPYSHFGATSSIHAPPCLWTVPDHFKIQLLWLIAKTFCGASTRGKKSYSFACHYVALINSPYVRHGSESAVSNENRHSSRLGIVSGRLCSSRPISNYRVLSLLITSGSAWLWQCDDGCCALALPSHLHAQTVHVRQIHARSQNDAHNLWHAPPQIFE